MNILDYDCRKFQVGWLVYYFKGEIKVKKGNVRLGHTFYPEGERIWHCGIPSKPMVCTSKGKVLVWNEEDIPKAKEMIYQHYLKKVDEVKDIAVSALDNIRKMVEKENMKKIENRCVSCPQGCIHCGRDQVEVLTCDDCGDEAEDLWYGNDGGMYCKYCITGYIEKVERR